MIVRDGTKKKRKYIANEEKDNDGGKSFIHDGKRPPSFSHFQDLSRTNINLAIRKCGKERPTISAIVQLIVTV